MSSTTIAEQQEEIQEQLERDLAFQDWDLGIQQQEQHEQWFALEEHHKYEQFMLKKKQEQLAFQQKQERERKLFDHKETQKHLAFQQRELPLSWEKRKSLLLHLLKQEQWALRQEELQEKPDLLLPKHEREQLALQQKQEQLALQQEQEQLALQQEQEQLALKQKQEQMDQQWEQWDKKKEQWDKKKEQLMRAGAVGASAEGAVPSAGGAGASAEGAVGASAGAGGAAASGDTCAGPAKSAIERQNAMDLNDPKILEAARAAVADVAATNIRMQLVQIMS